MFNIFVDKLNVSHCKIIVMSSFSMDNTMKIGFLGLGNMGFPMARNLMKKGYTVYGVDVNSDNENQFAEIGGKVGFTSETLSNEVNIIFTSLPTTKIVEDVYLGSDGLVENGKTPLTLIDLSTISPELNKKVAKSSSEKGIQYLGVPVSGSVSGAEAATLSLLVGGKKGTYDSTLPHLEVLGKNVFHVGEDHGSGTTVKLINNLLLGIHTQAVAEALSIADAAGLERDTVYDIVNVSTGQSGAFTRNYKNFIAKDEYYNGAFTMAHLLKDLNLANDFSNSFEDNLPLGEMIINYFESNIDGYLDKDISSAYLMLKNKG